MRERSLFSENASRLPNRASILIHRRRSDDFTWKRAARSGPGPTQVRMLANFTGNALAGELSQANSLSFVRLG